MLLIACLAGLLTVQAQDALTYKTPPADIAALALAQPTPAVLPDEQGQWLLLLQRSSYPTIEELAQPELRLAGLRINPALYAPSRQPGFTGISIKNIKNGAEVAVAMPVANAVIGTVQWSPSFKQFAFTASANGETHLYLTDAATGAVKKLTSTPLNTVLGGSFQWVNETELLYKCVTGASQPGQQAPAPTGPVVQESISRSAAARTFQDLLRNTYDETLFAHYATAQLKRWDGTAEQNIGAPAIYRTVQASPDGRFIMATVINKPFSYLVPATGFPHTVSILNRDGALLKELVRNPSNEGQPIGFDDAPAFPRNYSWRADAPATVVYVQALDSGFGRRKMPYHDAVMSLDISSNPQPKQLFKTARRISGIWWGNENLALFTDNSNFERKTRISRFNPATGTVDSLFERSSNDSYNDLGQPVMKRNRYGRPVLLVQNGKDLLFTSEGDSPQGSMPVLQQWDVQTGKRTLLWQSAAPYYEYVVEVIDPKNGVLLTSREGLTEVPNFYLRNLRRKIAPIQLTHFKNPYPSLQGVSKQKISYARADGVNLTGDLYLPKGYDAKRDGALPVFMWAYPIEYKSAADAAQVRGSRYRFTRLNWGSPIYWVTQGYAVLDGAEMPIVGENGKEPNDNFVPQLYQNAHAAIQKLASMGVGDSNRVAVGGHSYGAFMTANLLAHTKLFKAGIARSGAYNRTLTPFGFQGEERTYWQAPEVYNTMSPFMYADKIKTPLLLVHGELDNNMGTFPIQSERFYNAIKGHGGTVRYVVMPFESHGYAAKENILHLLWEQNQWLERWVKGSNTGSKTF